MILASQDRFLACSDAAHIGGHTVEHLRVKTHHRPHRCWSRGVPCWSSEVVPPAEFEYAFPSLEAGSCYDDSPGWEAICILVDTPGNLASREPTARLYNRPMPSLSYATVRAALRSRRRLVRKLSTSAHLVEQPEGRYTLLNRCAGGEG
jgi:hypothetical protein